MARKLAALAAAGVNMGFMVSRRSPERPGSGVVFVTPIKGTKQQRSAGKAGFHKTQALHGVRAEGPDKAGLCAGVAQVVADAGINLRGFSAAALGRRAVMHLAFDSEEDARRAISLLRKM